MLQKNGMQLLAAWKKPSFICFTASLFFFYEAIQMAMFNSISIDLMKDFNIDGVKLANISAAYFWTNVLFLVPAGLLLDKFSTKWLLVMAMTISVAGTFLFAFSKNYEMTILARSISGIGASFVFIGSVKLISQWFPVSFMSFLTGLLITIGFLGGIAAQTPFMLLTEKIGWRHAVITLALVGLCIIISLAFVVKDNLFLKRNKKSETAALSPFLFQAKSVILNKFTWLGGSYVMLMNMPMLVLATLWNNIFLKQVYKLDDIQSSIISMVLFVGIMIGSPLVGLFADRFKKHRCIMMAFALSSAAVIAMISYFKLSLFFLFFCYLLIGLLSSAQCLGYATVIKKNEHQFTATATSIASILVMSMGALFKIFFGWILDFTWSGHTGNGIRIYSAHSFLMGMLLIIFSFLIAFIIAFHIDQSANANS